MTVNRRIPEAVDKYLGEVMDLYLWGFDPAAIAMACSSFERIGRHTLLVLGLMTEAQLRRERPAASEIKSNLRQAGFLGATSDAVEYLVIKRNAVLHEQIGSEEEMRATSKRCMQSLIDVATELHPSWPAA